MKILMLILLMVQLAFPQKILLSHPHTPDDQIGKAPQTYESTTQPIPHDQRNVKKDASEKQRQEQINVHKEPPLQPLPSWYPKREAEDLPACQHLDMTKNFSKVRNLEDFMENCSIEEGYSVYDNGGRGGTLDQLHILKNAITYARWSESDEHRFCKSDLTDINLLPDKTYQDFIAFLEKHRLRQKSLLAVAFPIPLEEFYSFWCKDTRLCDLLLRNPWGENKSHYYVLGTIDYRYTWNPVLNIDDKLYWVWTYTSLKKTLLAKESEWKVSALSGDTLFVSRFMDNQIVNDPKLLAQEEKGYWLTKFKIKRCEINLWKIPPS